MTYYSRTCRRSRARVCIHAMAEGRGRLRSVPWMACEPLHSSEAHEDESFCRQCPVQRPAGGLDPCPHRTWRAGGRREISGGRRPRRPPRSANPSRAPSVSPVAKMADTSSKRARLGGRPSNSGCTRASPTPAARLKARAERQGCARGSNPRKRAMAARSASRSQRSRKRRAAARGSRRRHQRQPAGQQHAPGKQVP